MRLLEDSYYPILRWHECQRLVLNLQDALASNNAKSHEPLGQEAVQIAREFCASLAAPLVYHEYLEVDSAFLVPLRQYYQALPSTTGIGQFGLMCEIHLLEEKVVADYSTEVTQNLIGIRKLLE